MTFSLSLPLLLIISGFAAGLVFMTFGAVLAWRDASKRFGDNSVDVQSMLMPEIGTIIERIETRLSAQELQRCADMELLRQDLAHMRSDVEWLAGERMIEQAIQMCRDGLPTERISADLGLQPEAIRTLKLLRTH
ncbi:hypothetical protein [Pseudotabrizicola algicola]|uniref:DUF2802 domain-containing protein n=1 Tax=Pseudotabrizicola algicola TaxID=2709381 RepID=A0A6B3RLX5_9RHOB|nr:hypothetical protein [Pseudotabrizicola algicola]NEX45265.1 hypothetical protein [Pseudotabrizicola algicola]